MVASNLSRAADRLAAQRVAMFMADGLSPAARARATLGNGNGPKAQKTLTLK